MDPVLVPDPETVRPSGPVGPTVAPVGGYGAGAPRPPSTGSDRVADDDRAGAVLDSLERGARGGFNRLTARVVEARVERGTRAERARLATWRAVTPLGRTVGGAGILATVLAWGFGWEELSVVAVACLLGIGIGIVFLLAGQNDLRVHLDLGTRRVVVGDPASTEVVTSNVAARRMLPVRLETRVGRGSARVNVPGLAAGASHQELFTIPTTRRAVIPVGPVRSVQGDPLGLVRREVLWTGTEDLYVHPRTVRIGPLTTGWQRDLEGETTNDRSPSDVAFHTLREYAVGDDRRHIHWRTTARQIDGKLMVREFVDTRRAHVGVVLSLRSADWSSVDEFELGVSVAASIGLRALGDEQEVTCLAGSRAVPAHHGVPFLDSLARIDRGDDDLDAAAIVRRGRDALASISVGVVVTGSKGEAAVARRAADQFGRGAATLVLVIDDRVVSARRSGGGTAVLDLGALADLPRVLAGALDR